MTPNERDAARWAQENAAWIERTDWRLGNMNAFLGKLGGRKFLVAVFGTLAIALHASLGIDPETVNWIGTILTGYILGQGFADGLSKGATSTLPGTPGSEAIHDEDVPESAR
jgi:hypothetical protein